MNIHLGKSSDLQVLQGHIDLPGKQIVDVGCGKGDFAAAIAGVGGTVTGVEPDPVQAAKNREVTTVEGLTLVEAGAENLPLEDGSQDLLIFRFSLHHITPPLYPVIFREAARVLRADGQLYVVEPVADGSAHYVMELYHDETEVRACAQAALKEDVTHYFTHKATFHYDVIRRHENFDNYLKRYGKQSYNCYSFEQVDNKSVKKRFMEYAQKDGSVTLLQPVKADLFILA
ncbi:MAG: class I SAM-dependent methyltransferase [Thermodesulfobacteriota bacterium]